MQIDMDEAESRLAELGELVWQGQQVIIAKGGKPYLTLAPYQEASSHNGGRRDLGRLAGQIWISPDFDETSEDIVNEFENGSTFPSEA